MSLSDVVQIILETGEISNIADPNLLEPGLNPEEPPTTEPPDVDNAQLLSSKLDPIPVFTVADASGAPLVATEDDGGKVAGVFISQEDANQFVVELQANNPELASQVQVVPVSLGEIYQIDVADDASENDLDFAFVPEEEAVEDATNVLTANGEEYLGRTPLFVAKGGSEEGFLTVEQNGQQIIPFFFDLGQLEDLLARFEAEQPDLASNTTIEAVPLEGVIETLSTSDDPTLEQIVLIPTEEAIAFLDSVDSGFGDNGRESVYRFLNQDTGVHFYTAAEAEKDNIIDNLPNFALEGISYQVDPLTGTEGANVVHRFRNQDTGVHIYTIDETERSFIADNLSNYEYEGEVFAAYTSPIEGTIPVHRFYNSQLDAHFYTPSETERESVANDLPEYEYEGIAYYAFPVEI